MLLARMLEVSGGDSKAPQADNDVLMLKGKEVISDPAQQMDIARRIHETGGHSVHAADREPPALTVIRCTQPTDSPLR